MHEVGRPAFVSRARRRAAVAVAREHETVKAVTIAEVCREVAPHRERPEAFAEEHDRRNLRARIADPVRLDAQRCAAPCEVNETGAAQARSPSRNLMRWNIPGAVLGRS